MPLFYQQNINATTKMAIWAITEPFSFFESEVKRVEDERVISHPIKQTQHLAARLLLQFMLPNEDTTSIKYASNGKPYLENATQQFSISHCNGYAACVVGEKESVGIDIEMIHERVQKVAHKFLHSTELEKIKKISTSAQLAQLTFFWAAKEAMYKMNEKVGIDFSAQLRMDALATASKGTLNASILSDAVEQEVQIHYEITPSFVWAVSVI